MLESNQRRPHVCLFILKFGDGGVERMMVNIARGLSLIGARVDFIVKETEAPYLHLLPPEVRIIRFQVARQKAALPKLIDYLKRYDPDILLSAKILDDQLALKAKRRHTGRTRFYLRPGTALLSRMQARGTHPLRRWLKQRQLSALFNNADGVVAVSQGVADEVMELSAIDGDKITVIRNPTITPELYQQAEEPVDEPWLAADQPPLILGIGGLRRQKDFPTLLRAFALVRQQLPCRLMLLGQGNKEGQLLKLAQELGLGDDFRLAGFVANPYAYLKGAKLFVLSSLWEGSPNVLTEAMALGTSCVSTDCPSGPHEVTRGGEVAPLVPMGDPERLAEAMLQTLRKPLDPQRLKEAVSDYTLEKSARGYLAAFGLIIPQTIDA
ncbi:MAG: glycosyl transferase [gamma proteobacterium symbiont of Ctena orbiculata]|nr:MAG: glycosyl transferase [gamma proteobacterium symbiont of Ctena orbiculata]PVV21745.1 MAG: glycosyl transferase [gamma proteobacterium symbiont of Ctena orbiculata]PVV25482.1 MAG: glycosyl transferase [gamma proteobacterium symbiont of Ctena orbiculata]